MPYKNIEERKKYQKEYREKYKEKLHAQMQQYYSEHKDEFKERRRKYYQMNKDDIVSKQKEYYEKNKQAILEKMSEYHKKYYAENKEAIAEKTSLYVKQNREKITANGNKRRSERYAWLKDLKSKLFCVKCGESHYACLDFHHRDASIKDDVISKLIARTSIERVVAEIEKCDVLCANCHRKLHAEEKQNKSELL